MKHWMIAAALVLLAACASPAPPSRPQARGQELAQHLCSGCHAVGRSGESPLAEAPPFRTLSENYRIESLEEALAEGISVGHPAMPQFQFAPDDVNALVGYLQSIQTSEPRR